MFIHQCRPVQGCDARISVCNTSRYPYLVSIFPCYLAINRTCVRKQLDPCRQQLARLLAASPSSAAAPSKSASAIVRRLRDLAKLQPFARDQQPRDELDSRIDALATQFRLATADGTRASSRDLGALLWSLAKLSTPCCCGHAVVLLRALTTTSSPTSPLQGASNQTVCKALYAAALLARDSSGESSTGRGGSSLAVAAAAAAPAGSPNPPPRACPWHALLPPARALAAACVPRLDSFNIRDTASSWWSLATLSGLLPLSTISSPPVRSPSSPTSPAPKATTTTTTTLIASGAEPQSAQQQQHKRWRWRQRRKQVEEKDEEERDEKEGAAGNACTGVCAGGGLLFTLPEGLLEGLAAAAVRHMRNPGGCSSQGLANMLWGACRLGFAEEGMLRAAVEVMTPQARSLVSSDPRAFVTCLWALASLRYPDGSGLMAAASRPAAAVVRTFDDQSLSNLLWAYGTSGVAAPRLFAAAAAEVTRRADQMPLQFLAVCIWAFATANHLEPRMMAAVAAALTGMRSATEVAEDKEATEAAGRRWEGRRGAVAATAAEAEAALAKRLAACDGRRTQAIGNLAWSYAALGARHDPLVSALAARAAAAAPALNAQELSNVLYGMARLAPHLADAQPDVLEALLEEVDRRLELAHLSNNLHDGPNRHHRSSTRLARLRPQSAQEETLRRDDDASTSRTAPQPPSGESYKLPIASGNGPEAANGGGTPHLLTPRDLAMVAWSIAILNPSSPTLLRVVSAAASVAAAATTTASTATNATARSTTGTPAGDPNANNRGGELDELQTQPYNLFGLVQLYAANYAACLAAASSSGGGGGAGNELAEELRAREAMPRATGSDGGDGCGGGDVGALVRAAAAAMRQAQRAAEAIGGSPACEDAADADARAGAAAAPRGAAAESRPTAVAVSFLAAEAAIPSSGTSSGSPGPGGGGGEMVRFGALGDCPTLFRACRDAWFLNTASTRPSELQDAVATVLRDRRHRGGDGDGASGGGDHRRVVAVAEEALSPDRMLRVDLLVQYDGWLVLLEVDGPSHFATELCDPAGESDGNSDGEGHEAGYGSGAAARTATEGVGTGRPDAAPPQHQRYQRHQPRRWRRRRPLGDTVLRNRFLAASLGITSPWGPSAFDRSPDCFQEAAPEPGAQGFVVRSTLPVDPWVIQGLREQLRVAAPGQKGSCAEEAAAVHVATSTWSQGNSAQCSEEEGSGRDGCSGSGDAAGSACVGALGTHYNDGGARRASSAADSTAVPGSDGGRDGPVQGVAVVTLSYMEWNAVAGGAGDKWLSCLQPLLTQVVCTGVSS